MLLGHHNHLTTSSGSSTKKDLIGCEALKWLKGTRSVSEAPTFSHPSHREIWDDRGLCERAIEKTSACDQSSCNEIYWSSARKFAQTIDLTNAGYIAVRYSQSCFYPANPPFPRTVVDVTTRQASVCTRKKFQSVSHAFLSQFGRYKLQV